MSSDLQKLVEQQAEVIKTLQATVKSLESVVMTLAATKSYTPPTHRDGRLDSPWTTIGPWTTSSPTTGAMYFAGPKNDDFKGTP